MGPVPVGISGRAVLDSVVNGHGAAEGGGGVVAFGEGPGADELVVAERGREAGGGLAGAFPAGRDGVEVEVGEGAALGPNAGVKDADDDVGAVVGVGPEADLITETEELGRASSVEVAAAVFEDGEDGGVGGEGGGAGGG